MQALLRKAFKVTLGLSLFPMGFVAVFGPTMAFAWTGQSDSAFRVVFWLMSARGLFGAFSPCPLFFTGCPAKQYWTISGNWFGLGSLSVLSFLRRSF